LTVDLPTETITSGRVDIEEERDGRLKKGIYIWIIG